MNVFQKKWSLISQVAFWLTVMIKFSDANSITIEFGKSRVQLGAFRKAATQQYAKYVKEADFGDEKVKAEALKIGEEFEKMNWTGYGADGMEPEMQESDVIAMKTQLNKMLSAFVYKDPSVSGDENKRLAHYLHQMLLILHQFGNPRYQSTSEYPSVTGQSEAQKIELSKDKQNSKGQKIHELKLNVIGKPAGKTLPVNY
ncbi:hypothetical protein DdX_20188 [Ditylenchus destructor]|uniref:Uncharacterized protein n=1 Tax=Ditylenchus destructor TaxID=166010 RepID=A0AAD4QWR8_9BILA|nr:hypothetical protein DdX_20188 [Ditylenchus destructor]